ncbi:SusC/RagA family TonB-linked outer membrane protein [Proteiniphilum sp. UBA5384]|uniref:SusC/RagA family TonB-linked outer membrane protein n=1 Tax=Proteiniphilum sp. UBA5384 TaxID=1947279 RepID=UPI0025D37E7E|nr:SusC/RagA family TonB-linked outer membrane protein [Proteiniphilum sp. UBA5384]
MNRKLMMLLTFFFLGVGIVTAQTQVRGTVVDESGEPVIGASIRLKGTSQGTVTDIDGNFIFSAPSNGILQFSYVGMKTQELAVKTTMQVTMIADSEVLQEVVVTGMTMTDKRMFTGAADRLSAEEVKIDGMAEISRALEGRSAGVSVQNVSGTFGTAPKIKIRGATSIYGNSKPLWVVDGIVMDDVIDVSTDDLSSGDATTLISSAIAGLNPDDIESFQILKDGSATSIYGARAMAGVIVVTTKKGKAGISKINYTGEFTVRMVPSYANFNIMNSQDQMSVYQEMEQKGYLTIASVYNARQSGVYGKMVELLTTVDPATGQFIVPNTQNDKNAYLRAAEMRNTDWFDLLFDTNLTQNHSISITSGNDKSSYYASFSAMIDPGWSLRSKVNRYTANLNANYEIIKGLNLNFITSASYRQQNAPGTLSSETNAVFGQVTRNFDINPYSFALNTSRTLDGNEFYKRNYAPFNIVHELNNNYMELNIPDIKIQGELKYNPIYNLTLTALGAMKFQSTSQEHHVMDQSNQAQAYRAMETQTKLDNNSYLYKDPDKVWQGPITVLPQGGIYRRDDYRVLGYDFRLSAAYNNVFNEDHAVNLYGAMELNKVDRRQTWFRGWGLQYTMGEIPFYVYELFKQGIEDGNKYYEYINTRTRDAAYVLNGVYSWKMKYVFNGTLRYEGSNKLGKSKSARWLPTWNVSGAWNMHEEPFFESLKPSLSHLTLKSSYSLTATRGPSWVTNSNIVIGSKTPWRPSADVQESALYISDIENSELSYEKKHELNIGLEAGFLNNKINMAMDYYKRNNFDLIGRIVTQGLGGSTMKYGNVSDMKSNGLEFSLSVKAIKTKDFSWTTDFIYSHTKTKITKTHNYGRVIDMAQGVASGATEGYPVNSVWSVPFAGLDDEGIPRFYDVDGNIIKGTINFQNRTDNEKWLVYEGTRDPTDLGSFGNILTWKGFRLNVFITYSFGNVVRLDPVFANTYSDLTATPKEFKNRWVLAGDEKYTTIPVIVSKRQNNRDTNIRYYYNAYNYSSERVAKGDFIRLKEISLTYDFPKSLISGLKMSALSLKGQVTNPFLLYADKKLNGQDPEFANAGGVAAPVPKQFTLTLRVGM